MYFLLELSVLNRHFIISVPNNSIFSYVYKLHYLDAYLFPRVMHITWQQRRAKLQCSSLSFQLLSTCPMPINSTNWQSLVKYKLTLLTWINRDWSSLIAQLAQVQAQWVKPMKSQKYLTFLPLIKNNAWGFKQLLATGIPQSTRMHSSLTFWTLSDVYSQLCCGLFYDQGTRSVSFEVKNDVFQICLILMFLYSR